jgi:exodeoxyribonuclease VII small subunit
MAANNLAYREAVDELEGILESIESTEIDLDQLAAKVERAAELIRLCRDRIKATEMKVIKVVKDLEAEESRAPGAGAGLEPSEDQMPF